MISFPRLETTNAETEAPSVPIGEKSYQSFFFKACSKQLVVNSVQSYICNITKVANIIVLISLPCLGRSCAAF